MKKKKPVGLIILLIILIALFLYASRVVVNTGFQTEVNSICKISELITKAGLNTIVNRDDILDTSVVGKCEAEVRIKGMLGERTVQISYLVTDNTAPDIPDKTGFYVIKGSSIDSLSYQIGITDNSGDSVDIKLTGDYDLNIPGAYDVRLIATDKSGNSVSRNYRMIVEVDGSASVHFETENGFLGYTKDGATYIDGILIVNKSYSIVENYTEYLSDDFSIAYHEMNEYADSLGFEISVSDGFRTKDYQDYLYNANLAKMEKEELEMTVS